MHKYDNSIILIAKEPFEDARVLGPFAREHNVDPGSLYNESEDYNKELFTGKLIYRVIDENGQPFTKGNYKYTMWIQKNINILIAKKIFTIIITF